MPRPSPTLRATAAIAAAVVALTLAGCGTPAPSPSATGYRGAPLTKPAEPGSAPEPTTAPAGTVVALPEGAHPWGVAVADDAGRVYLSARKQNRLDVYDLATGAVTSSDIPGSPRMIDLAADGRSLLVPAENRATLYTLALPSLTVETSSATRKQPHEAVQVGDTTFVSEEYGHAVGVIRDGRTLTQLTQPDQPGGITAVGNRVAVVDVTANLLFVYDARTLELVAALPAGRGPSHVTPIGGSRVAVCDVRGNAILTYDIAGTPRRLGRAAVPGRAFWIGADPSRGVIYTALSNTNRIAELRVGASGRPSLVRTVATVRNPVSFDRDAQTGDLYVGGYADSQLEIIPASAFR